MTVVCKRRRGLDAVILGIARAIGKSPTMVLEPNEHIEHWSATSSL